MPEKTLGQVAYEARYFGLWEVLGKTTKDEYEKIADAVIAAHEARRWKAIESAGVPPLLVGKWHRGEWVWKQTEFVTVAMEDGYTYWTPIPAPPKEGE